jgi:hypothetical protein
VRRRNHALFPLPSLLGTDLQRQGGKPREDPLSAVHKTGSSGHVHLLCSSRVYPTCGRNARPPPHTPGKTLDSSESCILTSATTTLGGEVEQQPGAVLLPSHQSPHPTNSSGHLSSSPILARMHTHTQLGTRTHPHSHSHAHKIGLPGLPGGAPFARRWLWQCPPPSHACKQHACPSTGIGPSNHFCAV